MKKPLKVISTAALAAVFASTSLVPVAAQAAEVTFTLDEVIVVNDGKNYKISYEDFNDARTSDVEFTVGAITLSNGDTYSYDDYNDAMTEANPRDLKNTLILLDEKDYYEPLNAELAGEVVFEDGEWIYKDFDEQPEDRLNETFFYNVA